jgi:tRNA threonylcarbamoyladenosine biosynthesis protein TsaB
MILTIRTEKPEAELGLYDSQQKVAYLTWQAHRQLAETIHKKMQEILSVKGLTLEELTGIVIYKGPGSFTGLRIGMSVANALAYSLDIPITASGGEDPHFRKRQLNNRSCPSTVRRRLRPHRKSNEFFGKPQLPGRLWPGVGQG